MCCRHLAPLSGIIHIIRAYHSLHHTSVQPLAYTQEANGTASSGFVSSSLLPRSAISSQVPAGPTRNVTGEAMPLAEAVTQLSFLELLQRCGLLIAPPQPPQLPVPFDFWTPLCRRLHPVMPLRMRPSRGLISLSPRYLLTWQCRRLSTVSARHLWTLPCRRSHTVLFLSTFLRRWVLALLPRFLLMCLFRLLYAVLCYTMFQHNYRSRSSLLDVCSRTIRPPKLCSSVPSSVQDDIGSVSPSLTCILTRSNLDCDDLVRTLAPRALLQPPP